jgi:hypothetical protein
MHPATRRLLQGEVARQYPKSAPEGNRRSTASFFALLTKRWIYALGAFVVLGVTAIVLLPSFKSENPALMAREETETLSVRETLSPAAEPVATPPQTESQLTKVALAGNAGNQPANEPSDRAFRLADATSDGDLESFKKTEESKRLSLGANRDSTAPSTRAINPQRQLRPAGEAVSADSLSVARAASGTRNERADRYNEAPQSTPPAPTAAPTPSVASRVTQDKNMLARGGGLEKDAERFYSQSFTNVATEALPAKAARLRSESLVSTAVLTKFQVQQVGNQLRVIDGDGSTYLGEMNTNFAADNGAVGVGKETAALALEAAKKPATQAPAGAVANQQAAQDYLWRVEGTNRTLNQNVVFTWNFVETTNNPARPAGQLDDQWPRPTRPGTTDRS